MGLVQKAKGKNWYYQFTYRDEEGNRKTKSVNTDVPKEKVSKNMKSKAIERGLQKKEQFLKELTESREKRISQRNIKKTHSKDTVEEYAEYWIREMKGSVEDNTLESYESILRTHIIPRIGQITLSELDQYDLKEFILEELADCDRRKMLIDEKIKKAKGKPVKIRSNERTYYPSIKKHLDIIKMMLDYAVSELDIETNVAKLVNKQVLKKIPESTFEAEPYDREEVAKLRKVIMGHTLEPCVILASYLGLRREEVLGLRWCDVDFENHIIHIRQVCVLVGSQPVYREKAKTKKSKAKMHMIKPLRDYLQTLKKEQEKDRQFFGPGYYDTDLVCRWNDGHPIKPNYISQTYKKLLVQSGLRPTRFHDLRHTVGEIILEETGDIKLVSDTLRHSNIQTTADIYTRSTEASIAKGLESLDIS